MAVSKDDFEEWLENPVTGEVLAAVGRYGQTLRVRFSDQAWSGGIWTGERQVDLAVIKGQSRMASELSELDFEAFGDMQSEGIEE